MTEAQERTSPFGLPQRFLSLDKTARDLRSQKEIRNEFRELRAVEDGPGGFAGYGNVKGYLDTHGTIMWHGCYVKSAPKLLVNGFVPDTHGAASNYTPTHSELIAYFTDVYEDEFGLCVEAEFHTTDFAQEVRTQLVERLGAGKMCGMSIGFHIKDFITILPKDYATEIPKYSLPQFVDQNLERAQTMWCVDICTEIELYEVSLTVIPSNEASTVLEVRSGKGKRSRTSVLPSGALHWRSKEFETFTKNANGLLSQLSGLDRVDREAFLVNLSGEQLHTLNQLFTMATRGKRDDDAKRDAMRDALDDLNRAHRDMEKHDKRTEEMHRDLAEHHEARAKYVRDAKRAAKTIDSLSRDDDDDADDKKDKRTSVFDRLRETAN